MGKKYKYTMVGLGGGGGGHALVYGRNFRVFYCFHLDNFNNRSRVIMEADRWGPGLGGGGTVSMFVATGLEYRQQLIEMKQSGWGGEFAIGGRWGDMAKLFTKNKKLIRLVEQLGKNFDEAIETIDSNIIMQLKEWADIGIEALGMDRDGAPQFNVFDLPGAGTALEVSLYYEWLEITSVENLDVASGSLNVINRSNAKVNLGDRVKAK